MYFCATVGELATAFFRSLFVNICTFLNQLLIFFFTVFERIGKARLVSDPDTQDLFIRISLLLGIFMVFRLSFAFIQYIIDPDSMTDKAKGIGNVVKRVVISVVLLVTTPMLFNMAYKAQDIIIDKAIISKLILGTEGKSHGMSSDGRNISGNLFFAFFRASATAQDKNTQDWKRYKLIKHCYFDGCTDSEVKNSGIPPEDIDGWHTTTAGSFSNISAYINQPNQHQKIWQDYKSFTYRFDALGLAAVIMMCFGIYIIITYTIQVGIRAIQLAYLQIIAPIPIMMYMTPKGDESLKKWFKQCTTTFFDFFIRVAMLCFATNVISIIVESFNKLDNNEIWYSDSKLYNAYILVVLIISVLLFAKKAPKLLQEIFPSAGGTAGFDFGLKNSYLKGAATLAGGMTAGAIGGIITGVKHGEGTRFGRVGGAVTGMFRGAAGGAKTKGNIFKNARTGMANQRAAMQRAYEKNNDGSDFWGRTLFSTSAARQKDAYEKELQAYSNYDAVVKNLDTELEKDAYVQNAMAYKQRLLDGRAGGKTVTANEIQMADDAIKAAKKSALEAKLVSKDQKFVNLVKEAEAVRKDGVKEGYIGFGNAEIDINSPAAAVTAFYDNKDSTKQETYNIKSPGGGERHDKYKRAEANSKYNKTK